MAAQSFQELVQKNLIIALDMTGTKERELADRLELTDQTVSNWIAGRTTPSSDLLPKICDVLEIPLHILFDPDIAKKLCEEKARDDKEEIVTMQELDYVHKRVKQRFDIRYSRRQRKIPVEMFGGYPAEEIKLLTVWKENFAPAVRQGDLLLIHCQETAKDGDTVLLFRGEKDFSIYLVKKEESNMFFEPLDASKESFTVPEEKLSGLDIFGKVLLQIRDY